MNKMRPDLLCPDQMKSANYATKTDKKENEKKKKIKKNI